MKKKPLSRRQLWRIQKMQDEYAARAHKREARMEDPEQDTGTTDSLGPEQQGLIISHFGQQLDVEALEGEHTGKVFRCFQRSNIDSLVTGDHVIWQPGEPLGVIVAQLPQKTVLKRPSPFGDIRPVAANIDLIVIVIAPKPEPFANLIDRYLVAAENTGLQPALLLNKLDLINEENADSLDALLDAYRQIGYPVLKVSSKKGQGMSALHDMLNERTSIFVGQSGVGKSALINKLLPDVNTLVGELSEANDKGKHTTTSARLYHFPEGGDLIDSPGIREFGLWHISPEELINGFIEFRPFLGYCKFRDCKHEQEPGCRLLEAVEQGEISENRLQSYRQILASENPR